MSLDKKFLNGGTNFIILQLIIILKNLITKYL